jgi:glycosyltransferase involved in cell wall biosynthesis
MNHWPDGIDGIVIRVLMIAYTDYTYDARVRRHAEALALRGDHVDVIALDTTKCGSHNGVNVIAVETPRYRGSSRTRYLSTYVRFFAEASFIGLQRCLSNHYDIVVVCTMPDAAVISAIPPKLLGSKVVLDIHDTMPEIYLDKFGGRTGALGARLLMAQERISALLADRVIAVHQPHCDRLKLSGIPEEKISVILNSPDDNVFFPISPSPNGNGAEFSIVCHGLISRRLGVDVAIEAMSLIRDRVPAARLTVIGRGEGLAPAKSLVAKLDLADRVRFLGRVPLEQLPQILAHANVGLVPNRASKTTHLMLPVKLLEYAALRIPTIAARLHTIEYYFDRDAVRYFEPGQPADLADAIEELWHYPDRRAALAQGAERVLNQISWPTQRANYYRTIDTLVENGTARLDK